MNKKKGLSNPKRLEEYKIDDILSVMDLSETDKGADIGCGTGLFSLPIAGKIQQGKLYSVDINEDYLDSLDKSIKENSIINVEIIKADGYNTLIKEKSLDFAFTCVVLHEIPEKVEFLKAYKSKLKKGSKIFIIEFSSLKRSFADDGSIKREFLLPSETQSYLEQSGYENIGYKHLNELVYIMWAQNI